MTASTPKRAAVVLLSGGMDSATAAAMVRREGYDVMALSVDYGQRHAVELEAARMVAASMSIERHEIVRVDLSRLGGSALTDPAIAIPKDRPVETADDIPATYVPARNIVFASLGLAAVESWHADALVLGINAVDYSGYPDCRPAFVDAFQHVAHVGTRRGVEGAAPKLLTPLIDMTKAAIVKTASELEVPLHMTLSCYDPQDRNELASSIDSQSHVSWRACATCDACQLRIAGFAEAGIEDPALHPVR